MDEGGDESVVLLMNSPRETWPYARRASLPPQGGRERETGLGT